VCVSWKLKVLDIVDARCNHEEQDFIYVHCGLLVWDTAYSCSGIKSSGSILVSAASKYTQNRVAESSKHRAVLTKTSHKTKHTRTKYKSSPKRRTSSLKRTQTCHKNDEDLRRISSCHYGDLRGETRQTGVSSGCTDT